MDKRRDEQKGKPSHEQDLDLRNEFNDPESEVSKWIDAAMESQRSIQHLRIEPKRLPPAAEKLITRWAIGRHFGSGLGVRRFAVMGDVDPDGIVCAKIDIVDPEKNCLAFMYYAGGRLGTVWEVHVYSREARAKRTVICIPAGTEAARRFEETGRIRVVHQKIGRPLRAFEFDFLVERSSVELEKLEKSHREIFADAIGFVHSGRRPFTTQLDSRNYEDCLISTSFDSASTLQLPADALELSWHYRWSSGVSAVVEKLTAQRDLLLMSFNTNELRQLPTTLAFLRSVLSDDLVSATVDLELEQRRVLLWNLRHLTVDADRLMAMEFEITAIRAGWKGQALGEAVMAAISTARAIVDVALLDPRFSKSGKFHCVVDLGDPNSAVPLRKILADKVPGDQMAAQVEFWKNLPDSYPKSAISHLSAGWSLLHAKDGNEKWLDWWKSNAIDNQSNIPEATNALLQEATINRDKPVPDDAYVEFQVGPFFGCSVHEKPGHILFRWHGLEGSWFVELQPELNLIEGEFRNTFDWAKSGGAMTKEMWEWREAHPGCTNEDVYAKFGNPRDWVGTEARSAALMHFVSAAILRDFWVTVEGSAFEKSEGHKRREWDRATGRAVRYVHLPRMSYPLGAERRIQASAIENLDVTLNWRARAKHFVAGHGRYVENPSEKQIAIAHQLGFHLLPGQTYVRAYDRGTDETSKVLYKSRSAMRAILGDLTMITA